MDKNGLVSGNTSIFIDSPSNDIGFWHDNVQASLAEIRKVEAQGDATDLERSNVLMKLEKTMLDQGKDGTSVVAPFGISIYPMNMWFFFSMVLTGLGTIVSGCKAAFIDDN